MWENRLIVNKRFWWHFSLISLCLPAKKKIAELLLLSSISLLKVIFLGIFLRIVIDLEINVVFIVVCYVLGHVFPIFKQFSAYGNYFCQKGKIFSLGLQDFGIFSSCTLSNNASENLKKLPRKDYWFKKISLYNFLKDCSACHSKWKTKFILWFSLSFSQLLPTSFAWIFSLLSPLPIFTRNTSTSFTMNFWTKPELNLGKTLNGFLISNQCQVKFFQKKIYLQ